MGTAEPDSIGQRLVYRVKCSLFFGPRSTCRLLQSDRMLIYWIAGGLPWESICTMFHRDVPAALNAFIAPAGLHALVGLRGLLRAARLRTYCGEIACLIVSLHFIPRSANVGRLLLSDNPYTGEPSISMS
jgi:hypothetical protein